MRILFIGGSHPRHLYYRNEIAQRFEIVHSIIQTREGMLPEPPGYISAHDLVLWRKHFNNRDIKERYYFEDPVAPTEDTTYISAQFLNTALITSKIHSLNYDICLVFGCGMIRDPLLSALPEHTYNLHLGLSPRYRGAATLFWPFYFLEPNYAGCTFHKIVNEPDAGDIVHQCVPSLDYCDKIHDISCRAVIQATEDAIKWLSKLDSGERLRYHKQRATGKNFLASDFQPQHLRMIYDVFDDNIVAAYMDGKIKPPDPFLWEANI